MKRVGQIAWATQRRIIEQHVAEPVRSEMIDLGDMLEEGGLTAAEAEGAWDLLELKALALDVEEQRLELPSFPSQTDAKIFADAAAGRSGLQGDALKTSKARTREAYFDWYEGFETTLVGIMRCLARTATRSSSPWFEGVVDAVDRRVRVLESQRAQDKLTWLPKLTWSEATGNEGPRSQVLEHDLVVAWREFRPQAEARRAAAQ